MVIEYWLVFAGIVAARYLLCAAVSLVIYLRQNEYQPCFDGGDYSRYAVS